MKVKLLEPIDGYEDVAEWRIAKPGDYILPNDTESPYKTVHNNPDVCRLVLTPKPTEEYMSGQELWEAGAAWLKAPKGELYRLSDADMKLTSRAVKELHSDWKWCTDSDRTTWHSFKKEGK